MDITSPADIFNANAQLYQERFMDVSAYANGLRAFCDLLPDNAKVFDVGCGPANIGVYLTQARADLVIYGVDAAPNMVELARKNVRDGEFEVMDARHINQVQRLFDGVVLGFCLPYLSNEEMVQLINDSARLLNAGGALYISTMEEDEHNKSGIRTTAKGSVYMYYHKAAEIEQALNNAGMTVLHLHRQPYNDANGSATDLVIVATKG